jgi:hypothetical protein
MDAASLCRSWAARGGRGRGVEVAARLGLGDVREGMELTCGAHMSAVGEREGGSTKRRNSKEKV